MTLWHKKHSTAIEPLKRRVHTLIITVNAQERELKRHSRVRTPVSKIARAMKRTEGALRQKAFAMGLPLGHRAR